MKNPTTPKEFQQTIPALVKALKDAEFYFYTHRKDRKKWADVKDVLKGREIPDRSVDMIQTCAEKSVGIKNDTYAYTYLIRLLKAWQTELVGEGLQRGNIKAMFSDLGEKAIPAFWSPFSYSVPGVDDAFLSTPGVFLNLDVMAGKGPLEDWQKGVTKDNVVKALSWAHDCAQRLMTYKPWQVYTSPDKDTQAKIDGLAKLNAKERSLYLRAWENKWCHAMHCIRDAEKMAKSDDGLKDIEYAGVMSVVESLVPCVKSKASEVAKSAPKVEPSAAPKVEPSVADLSDAVLKEKIFSLLSDIDRQADSVAKTKLLDEAITLMAQVNTKSKKSQ